MLYFIIGAVLVIIGLIVFLIIRVKSRKKKEALLQVDADRKRLSELDKKVLNASSPNIGENHENAPYESKYNSKPDGKNKKRYLMQVEEITGVSVQKYVFDTAERVSIGSLPDNSIVIRGQDVGEVKLQFLFYPDEPNTAYLENIGKTERITVVQKKTDIQLYQNQRIKISGGDEILIGMIKYRIKFVKV